MLFRQCKLVAVKHAATSTLGAFECAKLLTKHIETLKDIALVDNILYRVFTAELKMSGEHKMIKTSVRYCYTKEPGAEVQNSW